MTGGVGEKKHQTSFHFLRSLREVLTKRTSSGLTVNSSEPDVNVDVLAVDAMSTDNLCTDVSHDATHDGCVSFYVTEPFVCMEYMGWRGGLVVGRRTCDLRVAGSRPAATLLRNNLSQVVHTLLPLSPSSINWYQRKLGSKQAYRVVHQSVSCGLAVFADVWLSGWLTEISADLRETVAQ